MTDQNQTPAEPAADTGAPDLSAMENNLMQFLDPGFDPRPAEEPADAGTPDPAPAQAEQAPAVESAPPAPSNAPAAEPVAEDGADPELVAQFFTTDQPKEQAPQPVAATPTPAVEPKPEEPWAPFQAPLNLPPQLSAALFESDDTQVRAQALGVIINSIGNGIAQLVEQRFKEHYAPAIHQQFTAAQSQRELAASVDADFYGAYPDLKAHPQVVRKAFQIVASKNPQATYGPEIRQKVGALAKQVIAQLNAGKPAPAVVTPAAPVPQPKPQPYVAGAARPAPYEPQTATSPSSLLDELTGF